jgi:DHA1 family tetracycline resistance protein-like MFS transporter
MYGLFILPESLLKEKRKKPNWKHANPVGSLAFFRNVHGLLPLAALLLLGYVAQQSLMNVYVIYASARYGWTVRTVGFSFAVVGLIMGLDGVFLVKPLVAKLGERRAIIVGYIAGATGYWMFGFSKTGLLLFLGIPVLNMMGVAWPAAQSIMSRHTPAHEQGLMQGAVNSLRGIAGLLGPGLFTQIYALSVGMHPLVPTQGAPFYVASGLVLCGLGIAWGALRKEQPVAAAEAA